jgi:ATP-binding cassette, sub-family E, member 1
LPPTPPSPLPPAGIGKSTALKILAGKCKPNLGRFDAPPDWQEILTYFRGSELQNYFTRILEDNLKVLRNLNHNYKSLL